MATAYASAVKRLEIGIEEIILGIIIILNILAVTGSLTTDLDYIKKIISWTALGYLLYQTQPANILTGNKDRHVDTWLLIGYFMLFLKNLVSFSLTDKTSTFLAPLYAALQVYGVYIELFGLYAGLVIFLYAGLRLLLQKKVGKKSLLYVIGERTTPQFSWLKRFVLIEILIVAFFVVVFSLVMEWLAVAIDAPLLMVGLATYFFFVIKHKERFSETSFLRKFGDFGSSFYKNVIEHLKYKHSALRVVAGMLLLHLFTDTFVFIWSYISGVSDPLYFTALGRTQLSLTNALSADLISWSWFSLPLTFLNLGAILFLLLFPIVIWYELYKNKHTKINHAIVALCYTALVSLFLAPTMYISSITDKTIFGVDILTTTLRPLIAPFAILLICVIVFCVVYMISIRSRHILSSLLVFGSLVFVVWYISLFYTSLMHYYIAVVPLTISVGQWIIGSFLILIWVVTTLFYLIGTAYFIMDVIKHIKDHITVS